MKKVFSVILFLLIGLSVWSQEPRNLKILDNWFTDSLPTNPSNQIRFNETWGFTHNGKEYGVLGANNGSFVFEVKDKKLNYVDYVRGQGTGIGIIHRDYHTHNGYLYMVADEGPSTLQIADLQYLPDSLHVVYDSDALIMRTHNIFIDTTSDLMYACGPASGLAMEVFSLADPENPTFVHAYDDVQYVHDAYVRNDTAYLNCGDSGLRIVDFSNPTNPFEIASLEIYQDQGYNHSGWLSPDGDTYFICDETNGKRIKMCDVSDLPNVQVKTIFGYNYQTDQVAHNIMVDDRFAVVSYYNEGLRIWDYSQPFPKEIAYYDTYTGAQDGYKFNGAWGIYIFNPSKLILVSDRQRGLFLVEFDYEFPEHYNTTTNVSVYPTIMGSGGEITFYVEDYISESYTFEIMDYNGKIVHEGSTVFNYYKTNLNLASGQYIYRVKYFNKFDEELIETGKISIVE